MALEAEGFAVSTYSNGDDALTGLRNMPPDLAVFDVKMPRMDGLELLKKLRETHQTPVIFLTSVDDEVDQILGLRLGADDYITKPFSQRLLVERIKVLLRRANLDRGTTETPPEKTIIGDLIMDHGRHLCAWKNEPVNLTVTEYLLLKALASRAGMVKTRDQLIDEAYGESIYVDDRTIDSHIKRVRQKFKKTDPTFDGIETLYGVGYRYRENA